MAGRSATMPARAIPREPVRAVTGPWLGWASVGAATVWLILGVSALRLAYILWLCPYTLAEDEAHYWEWSRRLDWSYYSKGPGIAWIIAASRAFFDSLGLPAAEGAVRAPSVLLGAVAAAGVAGLARDITRDNRVAFIAALLVLLTPAFQVASTMMTIDIAYLAMWAVAAWAGWRALEGESRWAWVVLGAAIGAGFLVKYTMALIIPGIVAYAVIRRHRLRPAPGWPAWAALGAAAALLGALPIVIWNAQNDWPTARHLLGHLGLAGGDMPVAPGRGWRYNPLWTVNYLALQFAVMLPASILFIAGAAMAWRRRHKEADEWPARLYPLLLAAPVLLFYLAVTLATDVEPNWPIAAYVPLFVLGGWYVVTSHDAYLSGGRHRRSAIMTWRFTMMVGLTTGLLMLRLDVMAESRLARWTEAVLRSAGAFRESQKVIPTGRFMGADVMAASAASHGGALREETGREPFYISSVYGRASQLAYYLPGQPAVYSPGPRTGGRPTQYDFWPDTDLENPALRGRPAVLVGGDIDQWRPAFAEVREIGQLAGETKKGRLTFVGIGYRGFPRAARSAR
ncbi:MAG: glycosyltransferase family 39 protein [Phycisphaerales bacterium]